MLSSDYPRLCTKCQGYKTMPYAWNSTVPPRMCNCPVPANLLGSLAWECPRCNKINSPWKGTCDCTPYSLSSAPTCGTQPHTTGPISLNHYFSKEDEV